MSIDKEKKSNRLLASRRYTHDSFTDSQESFTNVLDLQASEIYTQAHKIPSSGLPYSGSSQIGSYYTDGEDNILRYWWRHKLTKSNLNNEVWFFLNPTGSSSGIGAQLIDSNQQTSFISPKYSVSSLTNATTEDSTPGYLAKVFVSTATVSGSVSDSDVVSVNNYTFDYKTGVVQFTNSSVDPSDSQYVYMSVYQYVGKTLQEGIELSGNISGSATSTGSFGRVEVAGDSSFTGNVTIGGNIQIGDADSDSLTISADLTSNLIPNADSTYDLGSSTKYWRNQYVDSITATGNISSSAISTGSIGHQYIANNLGVGIESPLATVHISASDGLIIPVGDTSQRSSNAIKGEIRFNAEIQSYEGYDGSNWGTLGGMNDVDQDTKITAENSAGADNDELKFFTAGAERLRITADGHISASGNITASGNLEIRGNISGSSTSTGSFGYVTVAGLSNPNLIEFSSSLSERITSDSSSLSSRIDTESGSFALRITQATASIREITQSIVELKSDSGSFSTRVTNLKADSGSFSTRITADSSSFSSRMDTESGSFALRMTQATASIAQITQSIVELKQDSASFSNRATESTASIFALKEDSASFSTRTTFLEGSGQIQSLGTTNNVLFSSITASDDVKFQGDLTVDGKVTAQEFHTEIVSSSIIFTSGSTKFGDSIDDDHLFTGSLFISGNLTAVNLVADSGSFSTRITQDSSSFSERITADSSSFSSRMDTESGSFALRMTQATASIAQITQSIVELKEDSGSFSLRMTQATASIAQITQSIVELKSDSGSFSLRGTNLETTSSALINNFDQVQSLGKTDNVLFSSITASDDVRFQSNLVVDGKVTAQEFHTEVVSSSIIFTSGSTIFGDTSDDKHEFTGSLSVSNTTELAGNVLMQSELNLLGSITASGNISASGNLSLTGNVDVDGTSNFAGNVVTQNNLFVQGNFTASGDFTIDGTGSFGQIRLGNRHLSQVFTQDVKGVFELDADGAVQPLENLSGLDFIMDPDWEVDENNDIIPRPKRLWGYIDGDQVE